MREILDHLAHLSGSEAVPPGPTSNEPEKQGVEKKEKREKQSMEKKEKREKQ
eukprot:gene22766-42900_t